MSGTVHKTGLTGLHRAGWVSTEGLVKRWKLFLAMGTSPKFCRAFVGRDPPILGG